MAINIHPLTKKIVIVLLIKITALWIFFKIVPAKKIKLTSTSIENHFLDTTDESAAHD